MTLRSGNDACAASIRIARVVGFLFVEKTGTAVAATGVYADRSCVPREFSDRLFNKELAGHSDVCCILVALQWSHLSQGECTQHLDPETVRTRSCVIAHASLHREADTLFSVVRW